MLFSVAVLSLFCVISASDRFGSHYTFTRHNYPHIIEESELCGRGYGKKSYVCDPHRILNSQEADKLDKLIGETVNDTICPCSTYSCERHPEGYKIGIALIEKMLFDDNTKHEEDNNDDETSEEKKKKKVLRNLDQAQLYARDIQKRWKFGNCDEDVIIFFSVEDNVVYTVTGDVARTKLTNEHIAAIAKAARRAGFHSKDQSQFNGLLKIVNDYRAVLLNSYHLKPPRPVTSNFGISLFNDQARTLLTCLAFVLSILLMI